MKTLFDHAKMPEMSSENRIHSHSARRWLREQEIGALVASARKSIGALQRGWLAGIVDGEGTIIIYPPTKRKGNGYSRGWQVQLSIANTDESVILRVCELSEKMTGTQGNCHWRKGTNRPMCHWVVTSRAALIILRVIEPAMVGKRARAKLAIAMQERMTRGYGRRSEGARMAENEHEERRKLMGAFHREAVAKGQRREL